MYKFEILSQNYLKEALIRCMTESLFSLVIVKIFQNLVLVNHTKQPGLSIPKLKKKLLIWDFFLISELFVGFVEEDTTDLKKFHGLY